MPDDAQVGSIERWILDGPWPLVAVLGLVALVLFVVANRRDDARMGIFAVATTVVAVAVAIVGVLVETPAERARDATRALVEDAAAGRIDDMIDRLTPDATLHVGRVASPGYPLSDLTRSLDALRRSQRIEENSITALASAPVDPERVYVELSCLTRTASSYGYVPSRWIIEWVDDSSGTWRIRSITAMSIAGRVPSGRNLFR